MSVAAWTHEGVMEKVPLQDCQSAPREAGLPLLGTAGLYTDLYRQLLWITRQNTWQTAQPQALSEMIWGKNKYF